MVALFPGFCQDKSMYFLSIRWVATSSLSVLHSKACLCNYSVIGRVYRLQRIWLLFAFCMAIQVSGFYMSSVQALYQGQYMVIGYSWIDSQSQMFLLEGWATPLSNDVILVNTFSS